jgi:tetratricopeptide (TPR) repeat protein
LDPARYRAFLSYSHRDSKWAAWLHKSLESYRPPKQVIGTVTARGPVPKRLAPIFRDREELASATDLGSLLTEALRQSACQIVICSPASARSKWVNEEILTFKRLGREDCIFALIVGGEPYASNDVAHADEECFPPALRYKLGPDGNLGTERTEPIAADARPGKDGRNNAKLKLIAGLLGVGFDALRQREQHRRQRQLFAIASGAIAGMVITSGLAAAALIARAQAQRQTVIAKREAETAKQTTRFLVDLFKISDPSEARGNSLSAREMLDRGAASVEAQLAKQPEIQATLMDTLGKAYTGLGLYAQAKPLLESSVAKREALTPAEPAKLALSLSDLADLQTWRAEYPDAERAYRRAIALQKGLSVEQRDDEALAKSLFGLGDELAKSGRSADAEAVLGQALALQTRLIRDADADVARSLKADSAKTLQTLAWAIQERDLNAAIPVMQSAVAMHRALWVTEPHPDYADALNDMGLLLRYKGDFRESEQLLRESLAMNRRLLGDKHPEVAMSLHNLALVLELKGDLEGANSTFRQALAMRRELLGNVHPEVAVTLSELGRVMEEQGDVHGAINAGRESLAIYRKLFAGDNPDVAHTMNVLGYFLMESGDYSAAENYLQEALQMRRRIFGNAHPEIASSLQAVAILQVATHKYSEALASANAAVNIFTTALSESNWRTAFAASVSGAALAGMGEYPEAEKRLLQSYTILSNNAAALPMYRKMARRYLETLYRSWGRSSDAMRYAVAADSSARVVVPVSAVDHQR